MCIIIYTNNTAIKSIITEAKEGGVSKALVVGVLGAKIVFWITPFKLSQIRGSPHLEKLYKVFGQVSKTKF